MNEKFQVLSSAKVLPYSLFERKDLIGHTDLKLVSFVDFKTVCSKTVESQREQNCVLVTIPLPDLSLKTCDLCGTAAAVVKCRMCSDQVFCLACDDMYHRHPKRSSHPRTAIDEITQAVRPPLPPKNDGPGPNQVWPLTQFCSVSFL